MHMYAGVASKQKGGMPSYKQRQESERKMKGGGGKMAPTILHADKGGFTVTNRFRAVLLEVKYFWAHQTLQIRPHFKL